ncbi:unnamed protein product [Lymnaea stagnalis]|uniref:3CxxC-type domain-containing protein n=1 Tax=Lymnaea stagnalis TaxID=6523 RepID=A0AAV2HNF8_LYMST
MNRNENMQRMYGFFRCSQCDKLWESSHVYCEPGTDEPRYGQECKDCRVVCMPYRVERIVCSGCGHEECTCDEDERLARHINPNRAHRIDLCGKCRSGNYCTKA